MTSAKRELQKQTRGYVILFTVLITSIILAIALGISNVAFREATFTIDARDSHYALFAADSAAECALHHLFSTPSPFYDADGNWTSPVSIVCGEENGQPHTLVGSTLDLASPDYIFATDTLGNSSGVSLPKGCGIPRVIKTTIGGQSYIRVQGIGYNLACANVQILNPRTVERAIEYTFLITTDDGSGGLNNGNNSGTPISLFDPNSLNGLILDSQNNNGGVLGSSVGGSLWDSIGGFFSSLFGINTNSSSGNQYKTLNQSPTPSLSILPEDGLIQESQKYVPDTNPLYNPATQLSTDQTAAQKWFEQNGSGEILPGDIVPEAPYYTGTTSINGIDQTQGRLSTGAKITTNPDDGILAWFNSFFGQTEDNGRFINTARQEANILPQTQYQLSVEKLRALPDGDERSVAIADLLLERYAAMTGDQTFVDAIDPKILVEAARTTSFQGQGQTPEDVKALFDAYGKAVGDSTISEKINTEIFSKLVEEFQTVSTSSGTLQRKTEAPSATAIGKIATFFKNLLGIQDQLSQVSISADTSTSTDNIYTARLILSKYGTETGDWAVISKLSPDILATILSKYTADGVITEDMVLDTINQYAKITGEESLIRDVDTAALTTVVNEARLETRLSDTSLATETPVSLSAFEKILPYTPSFIINGDSSWVNSGAFINLMNTVLPTGPITPEIAKVFIEKYEEATGKIGTMGSIPAEDVASVLNDIRAQSVKEVSLRQSQEQLSVLMRARLFLLRLFGQDVRLQQSQDSLSTANQTTQEVLNLLR